jgi:hypothetical protein
LKDEDQRRLSLSIRETAEDLVGFRLPFDTDGREPRGQSDSQEWMREWEGGDDGFDREGGRGLERRGKGPICRFPSARGHGSP